MTEFPILMPDELPSELERYVRQIECDLRERSYEFWIKQPEVITWEAIFEGREMQVEVIRLMVSDDMVELGADVEAFTYEGNQPPTIAREGGYVMVRKVRLNVLDLVEHLEQVVSRLQEEGDVVQWRFGEKQTVSWEETHKGQPVYVRLMLVDPYFAGMVLRVCISDTPESTHYVYWDLSVTT